MFLEDLNHVNQTSIFYNNSTACLLNMNYQLPIFERTPDSYQILS